jgi:putative FmdB family regulatory protein
MPRYDFGCPECGARFEVDRSRSSVDEPIDCPVQVNVQARVHDAATALQADPRDVRPVWHNTTAMHAHAPRRGRHRLASEEH